MNLKGIHHVSSLTANAEKNLAFYRKALGLHLVKKTVNQDNTSYYHLFYGDEQGNPGTELTFFEIPNLAENHEGTNSISNVSLRVASDEALFFWKDRFTQLGVDQSPISERFGHKILPFRDAEGHRMTLVADQFDQKNGFEHTGENSDIPAVFQILGLGPVKLTVRYLEPTAQVLTELMGYREVGQYTFEGNEIHVFETFEGGLDTEIHVEQRKDLPEERQGRGGVHHVAFRVESEEELKKWVEHIEQDGFETSGFVDRFYFRSLYFREPNGILFEFATDGPGFDTDEDPGRLGETLSLPTFLEPQREEIESKLKPLPTD
ncbi:ring-cleaving dioxygenase [Halobacillus locisalis]|uniref:Ring-cleaving dioxygenase n=1 Tax=Halobacillus locisalis TaxID=220753 RepID=A0A838CVL0_9BACI|nr:ring-cleaving dioxygenase [Halobacillus locisalis]MBA2176010.1 ring-cleaving dioxygenase [Halobacillus locisalis]